VGNPLLSLPSLRDQSRANDRDAIESSPNRARAPSAVRCGPDRAQSDSKEDGQAL
jgi:hypothetical protein